MSGTADPKSAREHARAQGGTRIETMPVLPPVADDLPEGVSADDLVWEETVAPGGYTSRRLVRGTRLRLIDKAGDACASLNIFNAEMPTERLNVADRRVLASIIVDGAGTHDTFCGVSNAAGNLRKYGEGRNSGAYPNGRDRLILGAAKHGLTRRDVHPCVNLFKGTKIEADGAITPLVGPFEAGREVILRAEMDVIVVIANCPHVLDPRPQYHSTPLRLTAWRGAVTPEQDPVRNASPEGIRAYLNTEDYYRR